MRLFLENLHKFEVYIKYKTSKINMLIVKVKKNDIERAIKELKSKVIKTRQNSILNDRKEFTKKSVIKRQETKKAIYVQKKFNQN